MTTTAKLVALIEDLRSIQARGGNDPELDHVDADQALLDYIGDDEVAAAFDAIRKWYA